MNESLTMRGFFFAAIAIAIVPAALGISAVFAADWGSTVERALWASLLVVGSVVIVSGLVLSDRRPRLAIALVALGAIGVAIGFFFVPFITIPLGIALVYLAYRRARNTGWRRGADTA